MLDQYHQWFPNGDVGVSINLSGISLSAESFVRKLEDLVQTSSVRPENICFEITETAIVSQLNQAIDFIERMKKLGVKFSLDDFGSGASSFGYLKKLPVDYLKIDGSLVRDIANTETDRAIVKSINDIAHMMGMETVAEFVENDELSHILHDMGVDYGQGYGIHKPVPCPFVDNSKVI